MIRLIIDIKEDRKFEDKNVTGTKLDVEFTEKGMKPTKAEIEVFNRYKELLNVNKKRQYWNSESLKKEIANELWKILDSI